jgi:hypothetical protein
LNPGTLHGLLDPYAREARLFPAAIACAPLIWHFPLFSGSLGPSPANGVALVLVLAAAMFLASSLSRTLGKSAESRLLAAWGGWPTTILLRHADDRIDPVTKARYHSALSALTKMPFPGAQEERTDKKGADDVYRSATLALIERERSRTQGRSLVHRENAAYGFRRNLFGFRKPALVLGVVLVVVSIGRLVSDVPFPTSLTDVQQGAARNEGILISGLMDAAYTAFFWLIVRPAFVLESGLDYGRALLRTLDS